MAWRRLLPRKQIDATKPFLLDVREAAEITANGTITGAVNIPLRTLTKNLDKLPATDKPIIVYCAVGYRGAIAMEVLQLLGYTNVKSILGGFNAWKAASLPTVAAATAPTAGTAPKVDAELLAVLDKYLTSIPDGFYGLAPTAAKDAIDATKPFLLDVREAAEITANGTIAGAVNIPLRTLTKNLDKLPKDKAAPIITFCAVGHRGAIAMTALQLLGYTNVKSISGGFNAWKAANLTVMTK